MAGKEERTRLQWAQRILEKELERDVTINDDNSVSSMYDLRIGPADAPEMAIEFFRVADEDFTETWSVGPAEEPLLLSITGDWKVVITKEARVNKLRQRVEGLLRELEVRGIRNVCVNHSLKRYDEELFSKLESLGIMHAYCFRLQGAGEVHLGMSGIGGAVDTRDTTVPEWVGELLLGPQQRNVLKNLNKSGATECHVFILVLFRGAPWSVESYLSRNIEHLPVTEPNLPSPVTGVWIASLFGTQGIRWDSAGWRLFQTREESSSIQSP